MANRRPGGMGGNQRAGGLGSGNRSFSQQHHPFQGNNVSPWQGNNMPNSSTSFNQSGGGGGGGGGGGAGGGAGGGLLNHLTTSPQQLALALTNLLQPQQQQQQQQLTNPPSLLSLNTSPAFSHQDNRDSFSRFGNRGRSDFRRNEPYKSRNGGWRQMDSGRGPNRQRNSFGGRGGGGGGGGDRNKSGPRKSFEKNKNETQTNEDQSNVNVKSETSIEGDENPTVGNGDEQNDEMKREWKDEKTDDIKKENEEGDDGGDQEQDNTTDDKKQEQYNLEGKYYGVPQKLLHCFVCNKDMWDGESFQKHIRGRAHKQMLQSLEESFHITVNILRENMRLAEEKKVIELNRMHRLSKNKYSRKFQEPESHCNMCDLKFLGKIIAHRKTEGHQRLKRFLHPSCEICNKEFPSRMDWVDHRFTPEHLRHLHEYLQNKVGGEDGEIIEENLEINLEPLLEESMEIEDEHPILELSDDLNNLQNRIPSYKKNRPLGSETLKPFNGFLCEICFRSFKNEELAQAHLKTEGHYYAFVDAVKLKYKRQTEAAAAEAESRKRKREEEQENEETTGTGEGDGDNTGDGGEGDGKNLNETTESEQMAALNGKDQEMYDPEEACNETEESTDKNEAGDNSEVQQNEDVSTEQQEQEQEQTESQQEQEDENLKSNEDDENQQQQAQQPEQQQDNQQSVANTPRVTRRSAVGNVGKNGAGPKSKKAKK